MQGMRRPLLRRPELVREDRNAAAGLDVRPPAVTTPPFELVRERVRRPALPAAERQPVLHLRLPARSRQPKRSRSRHFRSHARRTGVRLAECYHADVTVLQGVLAGAGLAVAILFGVWRMLEALRRENRDAHAGISQRIDREREANEAAHAGIVQRIDRVDDRAERRAEAHRTALDAHRTALEAITREVTFLSGRQAERDQKPK